jgi:polyphosphate kinase 2 (PPK2 family)
VNRNPDENPSPYVIVTVVFDSIQISIRSIVSIDSRKSASALSRLLRKTERPQTSPRGDQSMAEKENGKNGEGMSNKEYMKELRRLQAEDCKLQEWVKYKGTRVIVVFEGRDAAGKGGTIRAMTERVSPRVFRGHGAASSI